MALKYIFKASSTRNFVYNFLTNLCKICFVHLICITLFFSRFLLNVISLMFWHTMNLQLLSINQISKFLDYVSHHLIELYTRRNCSICNRHLFPFDIVKCVDALLFEHFPLSVIVTHVLNQLRHVNESIPSIHHVLNNEFNESNLTLRDRTRSSECF